MNDPNRVTLRLVAETVEHLSTQHLEPIAQSERAAWPNAEPRLEKAVELLAEAAALMRAAANQ